MGKHLIPRLRINRSPTRDRTQEEFHRPLFLLWLGAGSDLRQTNPSSLWKSHSLELRRCSEVAFGAHTEISKENKPQREALSDKSIEGSRRPGRVQGKEDERQGKHCTGWMRRRL